MKKLITKNENEFKTTMQNTLGITLIALVVTIIILLILAAVSFNIALGTNGIISKSIEGKLKYDESAQKEQNQFDNLGTFINDFITENKTNNETEETIEYWDGTIADSFSGGDGSKNNPYQISNGKELARYKYILDNPEYDEDWNLKEANAILIKNIYMNKNNDWVHPWVPANMLYDNFNGNNYFISGLYISSKSEGYSAGLFSFNEGTIENVKIINSYADTHMGGFISTYNNGTIRNCSNSGTIITGSNMGTAGICGTNLGLIEDCYNSGTIIAEFTFSRSGSSHAGIAGSNYDNAIIRNSYNTGDIINKVGGYMSGIVSMNSGTVETSFNSGNLISYTSGLMASGLISFNSGTIKDCYNSGNIILHDYTETEYEEYISSLSLYASFGTIKNCYTTGKIIDYNLGTTLGTIISDENIDSSNVINTYYLKDITKYVTSKSTTHNLYLIEKTEQELKNLASTLGSNWTTNSNINNGFPILKWQVK